MRTTCTYLDALRAQLNVKSDAAVAAALLVSRQTVSNYRKGGASFDDDVAARAADILGIHPGTVLLDMYAERTRDPAIKHIWHDIGAVFLVMAPPAPQLRT